MSWLAVLFALASAATAALSTSAQHHAASAAPPGGGAADLLRHLVRRPGWLLALMLGPVGFTLHVLALHHGPITLVQPLAISGLVMAVPIRAAFARAWPSYAELRAVAVTTAALAVFLLASRPDGGGATPHTGTFAIAVAACATVALALIGVSGGLRSAVAGAFLLGAAAGVLFGLMAVLVKATQLHAHEHGVPVLVASWLPYALVAAGVGGVAVNQLAYRTARLSASMPVLNIVNCLVAVGFAYLVFQERPDHSPLAALASVVALAAMAWGLWRLSRLEEPRSSRQELEPVTL